MLRGEAKELEKLMEGLLRYGEIVKEPTNDSKAFSTVLSLNGLRLRFFIDHRSGLGTLKIRRNDHALP